MKVSRTHLPVCLKATLVCYALILSACSHNEPQVRYRVLVEVETPEGLRRGTGVIGLTRREQSSIQSPTVIRFSILTDGEAVAVDLPKGRVLYASLVQIGFPDHVTSMLTRVAPTRDAFTPVKSNDYPALMIFDDPLDPTSVRKVDPAALHTTFGQGYRLARIAVAITDDPVSRTISRRLPWVTTVPGALSGKSTTGGYTVADELTALAFQRRA